MRAGLWMGQMSVSSFKSFGYIVAGWEVQSRLGVQTSRLAPTTAKGSLHTI